MLVGEVRRATTGCGSSWKLSGGSRLFSAVTKVSKNRHVRRAMSLSDFASFAESSACSAAFGCRLTHDAIEGATSQARTNGNARVRLPRLRRKVPSASAAAIARLLDIAE